MAGFKGRRGEGGQRGGARPAPPGYPRGYGSGAASGPAAGGGRAGGASYGAQPYSGGSAPGGHGRAPYPPQPYGSAHAADEPEYLDQYGAEPASYASHGPDGPYDDAPGHTRAFTMGDESAYADPYGVPGEPGAYRAQYGGRDRVPARPGPGRDDYGRGRQQGYGQGAPAGHGHGAPAYDDAPFGGDNVATYRAGQATAPPAGPRLHWKELLSGIVLRPGRTFWQMRDHTVWGPALAVTFLYGLLAVFGFDAARSDVLNSTLTASVPWVVVTAIAVVLCGFTLGAVTNTVARQLGGDGAWAPTIGLAMLISSLTDAPRLLFALFLGGGNGFVQVLGWLTWIACGVLLTSMVAKSHDLPWVKALGASAIQLVALLMLFKLPLI